MAELDQPRLPVTRPALPRLRTTAGSLSILRRLLALPAVGLALYAEHLAADARLGQPAPPALSWQLFAAGALLFVIAAWPVPALQPAIPVPLGATWRSLRRRTPFAVTLGLALLCTLGAVPLFLTINAATDDSPPPEPANTGAWLLWIAALVLFGAAFVIWERGTPAPVAGSSADPPGDRLPRPLTALLVGGLFVLAFVLRLVNLDNVPPGLWFDEAQNGIVAQTLLGPHAAHLTFIGDRLTEMGALYFYVLGVVLKIFGATIWPLRLLPALAGAALVPLVYGLGARLYGWRAGLAAAGLLAVSAWNLTFSRFGMDSLPTVALDVAVFLCAVQGLRTGRLGYFAGAGVLLGLALQMYYVARLAPIILAVLLVHQLLTGRMRAVRAVRGGIVAFAVGALLAFLPVGLFALQQPAAFSGRISEVSVFNPQVTAGDPQAFAHSLTKHLLMFNFLGDNNGRHNLPDAPMLDDLTAALFFLGLGVCVLRAWRWQYFFPLVWFAVSLAGGVLSLPFEAPQSHRTLENSVVTALLAGLVLGELWTVLTRVRAPAGETEPSPGRTPAGETEPPPERAPARRLRRRAARPVTTLPTRKRPAVPATGTLPVRPASAPGPAPVTVAVTAGPAAAAAQATPGTTTMPAPVVVLAPNDTAAGPDTAETLAPPPDADAPLERAADRDRTVAAIAPQPARVRRRTAVWRGIGWALSIAGVLAAVGLVASATLPRYFVAQAQSRTVWSDMYTAQAETGRELRDYSSSYQIYVSPIYQGLPPLRYLAPNSPGSDWTGMEAIPLPNVGGRDVKIILDPPLAADIARITRIYPHATVNVLHAPNNPDPLNYTVRIPATDVEGLHGVRASLYTPGAATPRDDKTIAGLTFDWAQTDGKPATLRLATTLHVDQFGSYTFDWQPAGPVVSGSVEVDGYPIAPGAALQLGTGLHSVVATDTVATGAGFTQLRWAPAGSPPGPIPPANLYDPRRIEPHGLTGLYRAGITPAGPPQTGRVDPVISFYFHHTPLPRPYNVEWLGRLYAPQAGNYGFGTEQLSTSQLFIDGRLVIDNRQPNSGSDTNLNLTAGWHNLRLLFNDTDNYSHMYLYWTPPGFGRGIIPSAVLWPQMGHYPSLPESGHWPTLAEVENTTLPVSQNPPPNPPANPQAAPPTSPPAASPANPPANPPAPPPTTPAKPLQPLLVLGGPGAPLPIPRGGGIDGAGNLYIYTEGDSKVHKFGPDGRPLSTWDVQAADGKPLAEGSALLVKGSEVLVLDAASADLLSYDLDGHPGARTHLCDCFNPRSVARAGDGNYWVADTGKNRVLKVGSSGVLVTIGEGGAGPGQFAEPAGVWESPQGTLYVADISNSRLQSLTTAGKPLAVWTVGAAVARDGNRVTGDSAGNVIATLSEGPAIVRYDPRGKELDRWVYQYNGQAIPASGIVALGGDKFLALFLKNDLAATFTLGK